MSGLKTTLKPGEYLTFNIEGVVHAVRNEGAFKAHLRIVELEKLPPIEVLPAKHGRHYRPVIKFQKEET